VLIETTYQRGMNGLNIVVITVASYVMIMILFRK